MSATATTDAPDRERAAEEERLARLAAHGDGAAFATLYERYERRAFNLATRISGSEDDAADAIQDAFVNVLRRLPQLEGRELAFGSYLFTATRNACYDLMAKRRRAEPSDAIPETAVPVGAAAGGSGSDPGAPEEDPDRRLLLESQQEEVRAANSRLPERQREVLALRELEELSYDEIAEIMGMNRNSVAQLISRARIKLRDELRGSALAAIAGSSPECERALPLIALRDDRQLPDDGEDAVWLDAHLADCHACRLGVEAMQEAGASYRAWAPIAAAPFLFRDTLAKAADAAGFDWSDTIAARSPGYDSAAYHPSMPPLYRTGVASVRRRRGLWIAGGLAGAGLLTLAVAVAVGGDSPMPRPAAETVGTPVSVGAPEPAVADPAARKGKAKKALKPAGRRPGPAATSAPATAAPDTPTASPPAVGAVPAPTTGPRRGTGPNPRRQQPAADSPSPPAGVPPAVTPPSSTPTPEPPPAEPPPADPPPADPPVREPPVGKPPVRKPPVRQPPPTRYPGLPTEPPR